MKIKNYITVMIMACFFLFFFVWNLFGEKADYSESERRVLAKFPSITCETVLSGTFTQKFEEYAVDAFPMRDKWRTMKAYVRTGLFMQADNHSIYTADGHISKMEYPMNREMVDYAISLFSKVRELYLKNNNVYLGVIPDKNSFLAEKNGYLSMDYEEFSAYMKAGMDYATYIEIADLLEMSDYYYTDTHWRQENIVDVTERIAEAMGVCSDQEYEVYELEVPFYGVYSGQSALFHEPDVIRYLTNDTIEQLKVEGATAVYDRKKANGKDPYEMFLSGNQPVVTITNPENRSGKRLILFRDSFGSSIAPLFANGYSEIVMVDLRYISSDLLGQYVDFEGADVLFLYSTILLNNSLGMK